MTDLLARKLQAKEDGHAQHARAQLHHTSNASHGADGRPPPTHNHKAKEHGHARRAHTHNDSTYKPQHGASTTDIPIHNRKTK